MPNCQHFYAHDIKKNCIFNFDCFEYFNTTFCIEHNKNDSIIKYTWEKIKSVERKPNCVKMFYNHLKFTQINGRSLNFVSTA